MPRLREASRTKGRQPSNKTTQGKKRPVRSPKLCPVCKSPLTMKRRWLWGQLLLYHECSNELCSSLQLRKVVTP